MTHRQATAWKIAATLGIWSGYALNRIARLVWRIAVKGSL